MGNAQMSIVLINYQLSVSRNRNRHMRGLMKVAIEEIYRRLENDGAGDRHNIIINCCVPTVTCHN